MNGQSVLRSRLLTIGLVIVLLVGSPLALTADGKSVASAMSDRVPETPFPGPSHAIGSAANGCLSGGVSLPVSGRGWETLRLERNRFWGHPALLALIEDDAGKEASLGWRLLIGDMAQPRGGHMAFGHGSHQTGVDVDILYRLLNRPLSDEERASPATDSVLTEDGRLSPALWGRDQVAMLRIFAKDPRVERIFVNPMIKQALCLGVGEDREWLRVLRPWWGHDDHFHVRIHCPDGDADCISGAPLPAGDGCGAELQSWITSGDWKSPRKSSSGPENVRRPESPSACRVILGNVVKK